MPQLIGDLYSTDFNLKEVCPKCKSVVTFNIMRDYLTNPFFNCDKSNKITFYCDECDNMFKVDYLLEINFKKAEK